MEMSGYFRGGYYSGGDLQFTPEKPGKDHFIVEDLFDFPNDDDTGLVGGDADGVFDAVTGNMTDSSIVTTGDRYSSSYSGHGPHFSGDFCEPYDELAELEWLSNFVEDCFSSQDHQKLHQISHIKSSSETESDISTITGRTTQSALFPPETAVPAKARSKRSRGAPTKWSSRLPLLSLTPASSSDSGNKTPKPVAVSDGRKCLHCASDRTPQWRTGPMGPKTLCNACGVRYKSGRLVPEYRPAASPTFVVSKHSNSHRKVVELRRKKELQQQQQQLFWS